MSVQLWTYLLIFLSFGLYIVIAPVSYTHLRAHET